ncbi:MAG: DUF1993 family protein [Halioglobus sp.]
MSISLYTTSVSNYLQTLDAVSSVLSKGAEHAANEGIDMAELLATRLRDDMLPFSFQVISVVHHSRGAIEGAQAGVFTPPPSLDLDYAGLQALVADAAAFLRGLEKQDIDALEGKAMKFKMGDFEIPFSAEDFLLTFSLPNFYFHATTTYSILRMLGTPLGKMDFLGAMRVAS